MLTATLRLALLSFVVGACSSGGAGQPGAAGSCPRAGDRPCVGDPAVTRDEADACARCSAEHERLLGCDPTGGFTCVEGNSETSKDATCKAQADAYESCFVRVLKEEGH
jgi:hypothetical protein